MNATIKGSAVLVIKGLESLPARLDAAMSTGLARGLLYAVGVAQREYLSGPRPEKLDIRTRRLRDSVVSEVEKLPGKIVGRMGTNVEYAAFHEFGFHGIIDVRAHTRIIGHVRAGKTLPSTKQINKAPGTGPGYRKDIRPGFVRMGLSNMASVQTVRAHTRELDYPGQPFIRPALEQSLGAITAEINKEVKGQS